MYNTMAALIAQTMVMESMLTELFSLLTPEQRALLRSRLIQHEKNAAGSEFEPHYSDYRQARYTEWLAALGPKH